MCNLKRKNSHWLLFLNIPLTLLVITMIVYFSSRNGDDTYQDSMRITQWIAGWLYGDELSAHDLDALHMKVRECAHITLYIMLGFVAGLWVQIGKRWRMRCLLLLLMSGGCAAIGFFDEWVKQYIPGRHFHSGDFLLNALSALSALLGCCLVSRAIRAVCCVVKRKRGPLGA